MFSIYSIFFTTIKTVVFVTESARLIMSDSRNSSRKNTEAESSIEVVQIDGLVIMKLIKHCHELEASTSGSGIAQGALLGKKKNGNYEFC